jgi:hypothetical protein
LLYKKSLATWCKTNQNENMKIKYYCGYDSDNKWYCLPKSNQNLKAPSTNIITDEIPETIHPCNQRIYTSKSKFRAITKAHGKEEVGNEYKAFVDSIRPQIKQTPVAESISQAYDFVVATANRSESEKRELKERFFGDY